MNLRIPAQYATAAIDDVDADKARLVRAWLDQGTGAGFLFLTGPCGVGKTRLAYAIWLYKRRYGDTAKGVWVRSGFLAKRLSALCGQDAMDEYKLIKQLGRETPFMVIDDLGTEKLTEFVKAEYDLLLAEREQWQWPTVVTSNLSLNRISACHGDRIASRLNGGVVLNFDTGYKGVDDNPYPDYRGLKGGKR